MANITDLNYHWSSPTHVGMQLSDYVPLSSDF